MLNPDFLLFISDPIPSLVGGISISIAASPLFYIFLDYHKKTNIMKAVAFIGAVVVSLAFGLPLLLRIPIQDLLFLLWFFPFILLLVLYLKKILQS